jgi:small nuclear ribonucleoprotein (snRNP)-like protein
VRWRRLFDDLEAQADAAHEAELAAEVADRSRREAALVHLGDRLAAAVGATVTVHLTGGTRIAGVLVDTGVDWLLLEQAGAGEALVPLAALLGVTGVGAATAAPDESAVGRRLDLRWALRGLTRSRTQVRLVLADGSVLPGTLDRVGADHVDLAEHGQDEPRRAGAVRQVRLVPLAAVTAVRSG